MKTIIKILSVLFILMFCVSCDHGPHKFTIGYIQITQDPVLDSARAGLFQALADSGLVEGTNLKILDNNAQGDLSMIITILQSFTSRNVDMVITNSTPCMVAAAQAIKNVPVVFTVAFGPEQVGLGSVPQNLYGVFDPLKAAEFADLVIECIPGVKKIGIPYNNAEPNAEYSQKILSAEFSSRGITVLSIAISSSNDILQAAQSLAGQDIEAFIVAADNTLYLGLPVLAKLAGEKRIPLFVTDPLQAEKGAAIGFGVDYRKWGYQSGLKAVEIIKGRTAGLHHIEAINTYNLLINRQACEKQGLAVPDAVEARATSVIN